MYENKCQHYVDEITRLENALAEIKVICIKYTEKGWALNPDKVEKIVNRALEE